MTGRRKRQVNFSVIKFDFNRTLTTLADGAVTTINLLGSNLTREAYAISCDCYWTIKGLTAGEGPLEVGFAHSDLSTTEITEALSAEPTSPGEIIEREQSSRPVRYAGMFSGIGSNEVLNNGKHMRTKLGFTLDDGQNVVMYVANVAGLALTTGGVIRGIGKLYVRWL